MPTAFTLIETPLILLTIPSSELAPPLKLTANPIPYIFITICGYIDPKPLQMPIEELTLELGSISKGELSLSRKILLPHS